MVRNETIRYVLMKKEKSNANEENYLNDIEDSNKLIVKPVDINETEALKRELDQKKTENENLVENKLNGYIIRSKAQIVTQNERNTKYFASLEKKKSDSKLISRVNVNGNIITNQKNIGQKKTSSIKFFIRKNSRQIQ